MLGVSQPSNPPSSLRHSASFSCLQRGSGESHRTRTSTLPQQPCLQLSAHQYSGLSSLPHHQTQVSSFTNDSRNRDVTHVTDHPYIDSNDYGFVRIRPRLHSTNAILLHEDDKVSPDRENNDIGNYRDYQKDEKRESKNQNPLKGALVLFTASTSSWWKTKQREENITSSSSERKWSNANKERKWSVNSAMNSPEAKWSTGCSGQDRKWRSLGALLRTPGNGDPQSRSSQTFFYHNASASMVENVENPRDSLMSTTNETNNHPQQTCYSARVVSKSQYREKGEFPLSNRRLKVGRRLFQEEKPFVERDVEEDWMPIRHLEVETSANTREAKTGDANGISENRTTSTRSNRAQSFYLLDDFLRPQPQPIISKCPMNVCLSSPYSRNDQTRSSEVRQTAPTSANSNQRNVTNITPPRRHNSSSDSLEVATSPLPPPVPPPPPQLASRDKEKEKERHDNVREKEVCHCRRCWTILQQKWYHEEVSKIVLPLFKKFDRQNKSELKN